MRLSTVHWQARLHDVLLSRVRPRAVLVADTGEYALRLASFRRGVRFIELQHGVFDANHPDAVPLWATGNAGELLLPDILATRGTYWIEHLRTTRQGRDHAVAVGDELIDLARVRRVSRSAEAAPRGIRLVLTTQGLDSERLGSWIAEMLAVAPPDVAWTLAIKLHPVYDVRTTAYDALTSDARVRVIGGAAEPNVYDLLAQADVHLSIASSCHFDAAALGIPTIVIPLEGHEPMLEEVDGRHFILAGVPGDVWLAVARGAFDASAGTQYAIPGFVANLEGLLAKCGVPAVQTASEALA